MLERGDVLELVDHEVPVSANLIGGDVRGTSTIPTVATASSKSMRPAPVLPPLHYAAYPADRA
jgi:hypothetical protein